MYERAATPRADLLPIWHVGNGRALFAGPLTYNAPHAHSVPVLLAGLYDEFRLKVGEGTWTRCRTAVIPAGVSYEFDVGGRPLAVLYLEPSEAGVDALVPLAGPAREEGGAWIGSGGELSLLREIYEARGSAAWVGTALDSLLDYSNRRAARHLDPRVMRAVASLADDPQAADPVANVAQEVGLSSSRFQHLFVAEVGVPFRRYRIWQRLRGAIGEVIAGSNLTTAAHAAGFADQAHFAREFRRTFGAPASPSLRNVRRG